MPLRAALPLSGHLLLPPPSLISAASGTTPTINLIGFNVYNVFTFYNSLLPAVAHILINGGFLYHVSMCGSLVSSFSSFPANSASHYSNLQLLFAPPSPAPSEASLSIAHCTFRRMAVALHFHNATHQLINGASYPSGSVVDRIAPILNLHAYPGEVSLGHCSFTNNKLFHNLSLPATSNATYTLG